MNKSFITIVILISTILLLAGSCSILSEKPDNPNVVIIYADDLGYGDVGCYGATKVKTPNIDRLASQGRRFTDAHSASAVCSPSRYALLTGEYAFRVDGFFAPIFVRHPLIVDTAKFTIPKMMREAGYATACIGKWHLGFQSESPVDWNKALTPGPLELGFDYYFGMPIVNSHPPFVFVENHRVVGYDPSDPFVYGEEAQTQHYREKFGYKVIGGAKAAHELYKDEEVGTTLKNKAVDWLREHYKNPFFLYMATTNIHHPFTPAPQFQGTSQAGMYGDFIHELDWIVGEILNTLDELGVADNTLVIFTSDNGPMLNMGGQEAWASGHHMNGGWLGFKFDSWEGGHRVPFIARWPGSIDPGSTSDRLISSIDLLATLASLLEVNIHEDQARDSYNVLEAITGNPVDEIRDHLVLSPENSANVALRYGKWLYIGAQGGGGFMAKNLGEHAFGGPAAFPFTGQMNSDIENGKIKTDAPPAQLYDLMSDPRESTNLYNDYPEKVEEMEAKLAEYMKAERTAPRNKKSISK